MLSMIVLLFCIFFHVAPRFLDQNLRYDTKICHDLTTTLARSLEVGECQRSRQATWGGRVPTEVAAPKKTNSGGDVGGRYGAASYYHRGRYFRHRFQRLRTLSHAAHFKYFLG